MRVHEVRSIEIEAPYEQVFSFIADPQNLPRWAHAFEEVYDGGARLRTPQGTSEVKLRVDASEQHGTIDWMMDFPDGSRATAFSRLVEAGKNRCAYTFTLMPPPVPLEQLEGALEQQAKTLLEELARLARILSGRND